MKFIELVYTFALVACFVGDCTCISGGTIVTTSTSNACQVAILGPVYMCSGAMVKPNYVLTTAHCVFGLQPLDIEVRVGSTQYFSGGITPVVDNIRTHPSYNPRTHDYNVAVLRLARPLPISNTIAVIPLATSLPPQNARVLTTGFGSDSSSNLPDYLQRTTLTILPVNACQQLWGSRVVQARMFCAGSTTGKPDSCPGNEGAPLVYDNQLIGIYLFGGKCGTAVPSAPVFFNVVALSNWINQLIG